MLLTGLSILLEFAALVAPRIREPALHRPYRVPGGLAGTAALRVFRLALPVLTVVRNQAEPVGPLKCWNSPRCRSPARWRGRGKSGPEMGQVGLAGETRSTRHPARVGMTGLIP